MPALPSWIYPWSPFLAAWQNRKLTLRLAWREIAGRYRGSIFGFSWAILVPLVLLAIYTFVFSVVFQIRWGSGEQSRLEFALIVFSGLIVFNIFAECISRAPSLIVSNSTYVKKVIFPLEVLPTVTLISAFFTATLSAFVLAVAYLIDQGLPPLEVFLIPFLLLPLFMMIQGISHFLASLGVYIRDLQQIVGLFITILMFLSPLFYPLEAVPQKYHWILNLNPLSPTIAAIRAILFNQGSVNWNYMAGLLIAGIIIQWLGYAWFMKTRKGFADVL